MPKLGGAGKSLTRIKGNVERLANVDKVFKVIPTGGCHRRVRRERLLGAISGRRLTHPGLAGFPTTLTLHPGATADIPLGQSCCA